jgi:phosphate starvation-inducible membrane PsiE
MENDRFEIVKNVGIFLSEVFHLFLLFAAGISVLWAAVAEIIYIIEHGGPALKDILMLFIFIELGAMIAIYFKTNRLSVRFLIYVAITALTRLLVLDIKAMDNYTILTITGAIVMLTASIYVLRAGNERYGGDHEEKD